MQEPYPLHEMVGTGAEVPRQGRLEIYPLLIRGGVAQDNL